MDFSRITLLLLPVLVSLSSAMPTGSSAGAGAAATDLESAAPGLFVDVVDPVQQRARTQYLRKREYDLKNSANTGGRVNLEEAEEERRSRRAAQYFEVEGSDAAALAAEEAAVRRAEEAMRKQVMQSFVHNVNRAFPQQQQQQPSDDRHSAAAAAAAAFAGPNVGSSRKKTSFSVSYGK